MKKIILSLMYIVSICISNYLVFIFGPIITPINAFLFIGFDFVIRDKLHESITLKFMFLIIIISCVISFYINPASNMIAIASVSAFLLSSISDTIVYQKLIKKHWLIKCNYSNIFSSTIDSIVFPLIAFGAFLPAIVISQIFAKLIGGVVWSVILRGIK